jgi:hypothetical protein
MGRSIGSVNKEKAPPSFELDEESRIQLLANIIVDILITEEITTLEKEELCKTA